jgi:hypothetical protein
MLYTLATYINLPYACTLNHLPCPGSCLVCTFFFLVFCTADSHPASKPCQSRTELAILAKPISPGGCPPSITMRSSHFSTWPPQPPQISRKCLLLVASPVCRYYMSIIARSYLTTAISKAFIGYSTVPLTEPRNLMTRGLLGISSGLYMESQS